MVSYHYPFLASIANISDHCASRKDTRSEQLLMIEFLSYDSYHTKFMRKILGLRTVIRRGRELMVDHFGDLHEALCQARNDFDQII